MSVEDNHIPAIVSEFSVGKYNSWRYPRTKGSVNENWIIDTSTGTYILRRAKKRCKNGDPKSALAAVKFEHSVLEQIAQSDFPYDVPEPIYGKSGSTVVSYNYNGGKGLYWMYELIKGNIPDSLNFARVSNTAKMMSDLHSIDLEFSNGIKQSKKDAYQLSVSLSHNQKSIGFGRFDSEKYVQRYSGQIVDALQEIDSPTLKGFPKAVVHGDIARPNLIFSDSRLTGIIDFDYAQRGYRVDDIIVYLRRECETKDNHLSLTSAKNFLREYHHSLSLKEEELEALPELLLTEYARCFNRTSQLIKKFPKSEKLKHDIIRFRRHSYWMGNNLDRSRETFLKVLN